MKSLRDRKEAGRAQPLKEWQNPEEQDTTNTGWNLEGPRWVGRRLNSERPRASLYTHWNTLACAKWHTYRHGDSSEGDLKGQTVDGTPVPRNICHFSKIDYSFHFIAYEITQPIKTGHPHTPRQTVLTFSHRPHSVCGMCISQSGSHFPRGPHALGLPLSPSGTACTLCVECVSF